MHTPYNNDGNFIFNNTENNTLQNEATFSQYKIYIITYIN